MILDCISVEIVGQRPETPGSCSRIALGPLTNMCKLSDGSLGLVTPDLDYHFVRMTLILHTSFR